MSQRRCLAEGGADRRSFIYSGVAHRNQRAFKPFPPSSPKILRTQNIQPGIDNPHPVEFEHLPSSSLMYGSDYPTFPSYSSTYLESNLPSDSNLYSPSSFELSTLHQFPSQHLPNGYNERTYPPISTNYRDNYNPHLAMHPEQYIPTSIFTMQPPVIGTVLQVAPQTRVVAGLQHASIIPQDRYTVKGQREQQLVRIDFFSPDGHQGVPLSRSANLLGANEEIIFDQRSGQKMSYRILFPGGYEPYDVQKNVTIRKDGHSCNRLLKRAKLVEHIADSTDKFIEKNSQFVPSEQKWKVGEGGITLENLVLLSVELVSIGSLQPCFMYVDPSKPW